MDKSKYKKKLTKKQFIVRTSIVVAVLIVDLTFTGFLEFGFNTVRCGRVPVSVSPGAFGGQSAYDLPGNYTPGGASNRYLCTEQEAKDEGIDRNPLQGHMTEEEYQKLRQLIDK